MLNAKIMRLQSIPLNSHFLRFLGKQHLNFLSSGPPSSSLIGVKRKGNDFQIRIRMSARRDSLWLGVGDDGLAPMRILLLHIRLEEMRPTQVPATTAGMHPAVRATFLLPGRL